MKTEVEVFKNGKNQISRDDMSKETSKNLDIRVEEVMV